MEEINSKDRISRAKIRLLETNPFFAYLVSNMIINENNNMLIKSIAVDFNGNLHYDSSFIKQLSDSQLRTILCHEVLHLVFNHLERRSSRNPIVWNIGVDIIVNDLLLSNGFEFSGILAKNSPTYYHSFEIPQYNIKIENINEKTSEMIYSELYEQLKDFEKRQSSSGNGSGNPQNTLNRRRFDTHNFGDDKNKERKQLTQQEIEKVKEEWKKKIVSAMVYAKQRGTTPLGIDRYIDELLNQKINWKQLLYRYITNEIMTDYSYSYPSKRSQATGIYMPHIKKENIDIIVSVDTSGSINEEKLKEFVSELIYIAKSFNNITITLIICDCEIKDVIEVSNGNIEQLLGYNFKGGGGTSHIPIFDWISNNKPYAKILIAFTDLETEFPKEETIRTIWLVKGDKKEVPFGEIISLDEGG